MIEEARENFVFLIRENPGFAGAYVNYGYLLLSSDRNVKAADEMYDTALKLDPDNQQALLNKAGSRYYLGDRRGALNLLNRLLVLNPGHLKAIELKRNLTSMKK